MKEHPILFSTPMVQAILAGRKSQTRRIMKIQPKHPELNFWWANMGERWHYPPVAPMIDIKCPYGQPGDTLWAKETYYAYGMWLRNGHNKSGKQLFRFSDTTLTGFKYHYCDDPPENVLPNTKREVYGWYKRPSLFMPRKAARIFLRVTDIRVERLQDISEEDAIAEGIETDRGGYKSYEIIHSGPHKGKPNPHSCVPNRNAVYSYRELWESINGKGSWDANPWVWVIKFERI